MDMASFFSKKCFFLVICLLIVLFNFSDVIAYDSDENYSLEPSDRFFETKHHLPNDNNGSWFAGIGLGIDSPYFDNKTSSLVTNSAGNAADTFMQKTNIKSPHFFNGSFGHLQKIGDKQYLSLFFEYDYVGKTTSKNNQRAAFGIQSAANLSDYSYDIERQAFLLGAKLNLIERYHLLPYIEASVGMSENHFSNFVNNTANNQINVFPNRITDQMAYTLGLGVDWRAAKNWLASVGYRFGSWGEIESGAITNAVPPGGALPSPVYLENKLYSHEGLLKIAYLFSG